MASREPRSSASTGRREEIPSSPRRSDARSCVVELRWRPANGPRSPSGLEHGPGRPPPFGLGEGHPQVQQHAGPSRSGHREVHRLLEEAQRQRGVPALVVGHARLVGPAHHVLASVPRCGAAGHLPELGRGLRRPPGRGQQGGLVESGGDGDVRALDRQRQVAGSFLRVADDRRQPRVQLATPGRRDPLIDGGSEQGVGEPKAVADDLDDAVLERRFQATIDLGRIGRGTDRSQRRC